MEYFACLSEQYPVKYNATGYPTEQTQAVQASVLSALINPNNFAAMTTHTELVQTIIYYCYYSDDVLLGIVTYFTKLITGNDTFSRKFKFLLPTHSTYS